MSRVSILPFSKPWIAATTDEQQDAFETIDEMMEGHLLSQAIGWIIKQKKVLGDKEELRGMKRKLRSAFQGRSLSNWALVALSTEKVLNN